jgi:hypothetical protein
MQKGVINICVGATEVVAHNSIPLDITVSHHHHHAYEFLFKKKKKITAPPNLGPCWLALAVTSSKPHGFRPHLGL